MTAHLQDRDGENIVAVVSVRPMKTWEKMGFNKEGLIPTNLILTAAYSEAIYASGKRVRRSLGGGGGGGWQSFMF